MIADLSRLILAADTSSPDILVCWPVPDIVLSATNIHFGILHSVGIGEGPNQ
jgi:hypothetical protein